MGLWVAALLWLPVVLKEMCVSSCESLLLEHAGHAATAAVGLQQGTTKLIQQQLVCYAWCHVACGHILYTGWYC